MKKILILANHINWIYSLRKELIEELSKKYKVIIGTQQCKDNFRLKYFEDKGVDFEFLSFDRRGINPIKELNLILKYKKIITSIDPDIILTYTIKPNIYGAYIARKIDRPIIMNITGLGTAFNRSILKNIVTALYKIVCKKVNLIFFQNRENRRLFISNQIIHIDKTKLIPGSGVNIEKFRPMEKTNHDNMIRFLFIGRIMKEKGIEEYLKVAEKLTKKYPNIEFQILGSFEEIKYKDIIHDNKNERIKYLGRSDDVRNQIREVDCIVNPSYHEGMSNVLLEGGAMGKPLIASNIPGCKEIIDEGYNGYLFKVKSVESMEEKLTRFIELDEETKKMMGENSRKKIVKEFDRNIVVAEYLKAIDNILKEGHKDELI